MTTATLDRSAAPPEPEVRATGGRKKMVLILVVVAVAAAAGWWFLLRPTAPAEPVPGEVMTLEPIQVNLADGHYLRVGIALQLSRRPTRPTAARPSTPRSTSSAGSTGPSWPRRGSARS